MEPLVWSAPWALAGLAAIPALVAIYWLRFRYRPQPVSTLLFWREIPEQRDAGIRWQNLHLPLSFFLELLALLAVIGAALGMHVLLAQRIPPLVVILDDSLSMQAGEPSARQRAEDELRSLLRRRRFASVRLLLAGETPQWLGQAFSDLQHLDSLLADWKCVQPTASLGRALSLAREWGGSDVLTLVLTDTAPTEPIDSGTLQWWTFGEVRDNVAFIQAVRTTGDDGDRVVLEVANFSDLPHTCTLTLREGQHDIQTTSVKLDAGESQTLHYRISSDAKVVEALLPADALELDNRAWLLPQHLPMVRVNVDVSHASVRADLEKAFRVAGKTEFDSVAPHLLLTDRADRRPTPHTWLIQLVLEKEGEAFTGPYLLDRQHPLCDGLSLQDVVWGAGQQSIEGTPVISVGDVPLLTEMTRGLYRRHFRLQLIPELSTWDRSPDWPILWANFVHWRRSELPGPASATGRLGDIMPVRVEPVSGMAAEKNQPPRLRCRLPDGAEEQYPVQQHMAVIPLRQLGLYEIRSAERSWQVAVNMVNATESDLRSRTAGRWGEWMDQDKLRTHYRDISGAFLLAALALLSLHALVIWRTERRR